MANNRGEQEFFVSTDQGSELQIAELVFPPNSNLKISVSKLELDRSEKADRVVNLSQT